MRLQAGDMYKAQINYHLIEYFKPSFKRKISRKIIVSLLAAY